MTFGCQSSVIHTNLDIYIDTQAGISKQGHSTMVVGGTWISANGYPCFYGYQSSIIHAFIDIHLDIHRLLRILHGLAMDSRSRIQIFSKRCMQYINNRYCFRK